MSLRTQITVGSSMKKKKILMISDHALSTSGVGVQTKLLIEGLISKGDMSFIQLGGAVRHENYNIVKVNDDFIIKPVDNFGNKNLLRSILINEKPDALLLFTDPRQFVWLYEMEDEIHQICPILWWHVWDNFPIPRFNDWMYEATDSINCHSYLTYLMCKENFPEKTKFIPHAYPEKTFYRLDKDIIEKEKIRILDKKRKDNFVCLWMNRNCKRKRAADVLVSWSKFLNKFDQEKRKSLTLLMHTDPKDHAGTNLFEIASSLNILDTVAFSTQKLETSFINIIHNISNVTLNISFNEGFGLTTLESMMVGTPIIVTKTGGLYRQVIDHRDKSENGVGLDPDVKSISGSQAAYIFEDYVSSEKVAEAIFKIYSLSLKESTLLSKKVEKYAKEEFSYKHTINLWHDSLKSAIQNWEKTKNEFTFEVV